MNPVSPASLLSDIQSRVIEDLKPWEKTAYKVQFSLIFAKYDLLSQAPIDIDVFDLPKNKENHWALYYGDYEAVSKPLSLKELSKTLDRQAKAIIARDSEDGEHKAVKLKLDLLNRDVQVTSFTYTTEW